MIGNNFCSVRYLIGIRTGSLIPITFFRHITCIHRDVWHGQTYKLSNPSICVGLAPPNVSVNDAI